MNKFCNYVKNGKGLGLVWLFLYAFVVAAVIGTGVKVIGTNMAPTLQSVAAQLLPIRIENGVIVEPEETIKAVGLDVDGIEIPIVLDTTVDNIDVVGLKDGIYISRRAFYAVSKTESKIYNFKKSIYIENADYTEFFKKMAVYAGFGIGIFILVVMFVIYVVLSSLFALLAIIIGKILKVEMNYASGMRLSSIAYIITSVLMGLLRFFGLGTPWVIYAVAVVILQVIVIKAIASKQ